MSVLAPTLVAALGATLPAAALAWLAGSLAERLALSAAARAIVWRLGLAVTVATLLATPFGLLRKAARVAPARHVSTLAEGPARAASAAVTTPSPHFDPAVLTPPLALLLVAGMAVGLGGLLLRAWQVRRLRSRSRPAPQAAFAGLPVPVLVSNETASALLVGLIRPAIVLPARLVAERPAEELSLICAHELAHLRRRDNWRILADQALGAVLWFNPPARRCIARLVALREELCDAAVLAGADPEHRRRYAAVLLAALRLASDAGRGRGGVQPAFNRHQGSDQAMRLNAILHPTASSSRRAVAAAAGLVLLASASAGLVGAAFAQPLAGVAADAARQSVKARYESASAVDYQRACASDEPTDYGFCTGVIFGVLSSQDPGICQPGTSDYLGMEKQARAAIAAARPEANEGPRVFVSRVLRADFSCERLKGETSSGVQITSDLALTKGDVTTFEGSPTIRIIGPIGKSLLLVDGRKPAPDFDVNALPPGAIARITVAKADSQEARNLGAAPGQSVLNLELKRG